MLSFNLSIKTKLLICGYINCFLKLSMPSKILEMYTLIFQEPPLGDLILEKLDEVEISVKVTVVEALCIALRNSFNTPFLLIMIA